MSLNEKLDWWFSRAQVFAFLAEAPHPLDDVGRGFHEHVREEMYRKVRRRLIRGWWPLTLFLAAALGLMMGGTYVAQAWRSDLLAAISAPALLGVLDAAGTAAALFFLLAGPDARELLDVALDASRQTQREGATPDTGVRRATEELDRRLKHIVRARSGLLVAPAVLTLYFLGLSIYGGLHDDLSTVFAAGCLALGCALGPAYGWAMLQHYSRIMRAALLKALTLQPLA